MYQLFADKSTKRDCPIVGDQKAIDPPHVVNGEVISAAHGVPTTGHVSKNDG